MHLRLQDDVEDEADEHRDQQAEEERQQQDVVELVRCSGCPGSAIERGDGDAEDPAEEPGDERPPPAPAHAEDPAAEPADDDDERDAVEQQRSRVELDHDAERHVVVQSTDPIGSSLRRSGSGSAHAVRQRAGSFRPRTRRTRRARSRSPTSVNSIPALIEPSSALVVWRTSPATLIVAALAGTQLEVEHDPIAHGQAGIAALEPGADSGELADHALGEVGIVEEHPLAPLVGHEEPALPARHAPLVTPAVAERSTRSGANPSFEHVESPSAPR